MCHLPQDLVRKIVRSNEARILDIQLDDQPA